LHAESAGSKGFVLTFVLVIPLPPVVWTSFTERKACRGLGETLELFLLTEDDLAPEPHPAAELQSGEDRADKRRNFGTPE
jgi:hypothetical protein